MPNDGVNALTSIGDTLYVGGEFKRLGPRTGTFVVFDPASDRADPAYPYFPGNVFAIVSDARGGWFVGGGFTRIGDVSCRYLAHIRADKTLDVDWCPQPDGAVRNLALAGDRLYVAGRFESIRKRKRALVAALDSRTGGVLPWKPRLGTSREIYPARVTALAVAGSTVYLGGGFGSVNGFRRTRLAAVDGTSGKVRDWSPNPDGRVDAITVSGRAIYIGGAFGRIGRRQRSRLAAFDARTGKLLNWNPRVDGTVDALALSGRTLYFGGTFERLGQAKRENAAAVDAHTGKIRAWNPIVKGFEVRALALAGRTVYLTGDFNHVRGRERNGLAAVDARNGGVSNWNPDPDDDSAAIAVADGRVAVGGSFQSVADAAARNGIAALNIRTGSLARWNPLLRCTFYCVNAMTEAGRTVYVGGVYRGVGGQSRNGLAALDAVTATAEPWNPRPEPYDWCGAGDFCTIAAAGSVVYIASYALERVGGKPRHAIAAVAAGSGRVTDWNPAPDGSVDVLIPAGPVVYVGGDFSTIGGAKRSNLAAIDAETGRATSWNPGADNSVFALAVAGSTVYVGGDFTRIGGQVRRGLAAIDAVSGHVTSWNPRVIEPSLGVTTVVEHIAVVGSTVIIAGTFDRVGGKPRNDIAAVDAATGTTKPWNPTLAQCGIIGSIGVAGSMLYVGGYFCEHLLGFPLADVTR